MNGARLRKPVLVDCVGAYFVTDSGYRIGFVDAANLMDEVPERTAAADDFIFVYCRKGWFHIHRLVPFRYPGVGFEPCGESTTTGSEARSRAGMAGFRT